MKQLVADVSERLGYKYALDVKQVLAMFEMCRFDQAWQLDEPSPWCVVSINLLLQQSTKMHIWFNYFISSRNFPRRLLHHIKSMILNILKIWRNTTKIAMAEK